MIRFYDVICHNCQWQNINEIIPERANRGSEFHALLMGHNVEIKIRDIE